MTTTSPIKTVAAHFGSPAGELAACLRAVGLADRSDLGVLSMTGGQAALSELVEHASGTRLAVGGVVATAHTWWCRAATDRVVIVTEPPARARVIASLQTPAARLHGLELRDLSDRTAAIAVVGLRTAQVLAAVGLLGPGGDPRRVAPFRAGTILDTPVELLLQHDRRALLLVPSGATARVWHAIELAGRPFGLSLVGTDALRLLALHERTASAQAGGPHHI